MSVGNPLPTIATLLTATLLTAVSHLSSDHLLSVHTPAAGEVLPELGVFLSRCDSSDVYASWCHVEVFFNRGESDL